jgi:hypothetical protein
MMNPKDPMMIMKNGRMREGQREKINYFSKNK